MGNCNFETASLSPELQAVQEKYGDRLVAIKLAKTDETYTANDGYFNEADKLARTNMAANTLIKIAMAKGGVDIADLSLTDLTAGLQEAVKMFKDNLKKQQLGLLSTIAVGDETTLELYLNRLNKTATMLTNFDTLVEDAISILRNRGMLVGDINKAIEELDGATEEKEKIYALENWAIARRDTLSTSIKLYLSTLSEVQVVNKKLAPVRDEYGFIVPADVNRVNSQLTTHMKNLKDFPAMIDKLEELAPKIPIFGIIARDLKKTNSSVATNNAENQKVNHFQNLFYASYSNTSYEFVNVTTNLEKGLEDEEGNIGMDKASYSLRNSNSFNAGALQRNEWLEQESLYRKKYADTLEDRQAEAQTWIDEHIKFSKKALKEGDVVALDTLSEGFSMWTGLEVNTRALIEYRKDLGNKFYDNILEAATFMFKYANKDGMFIEGENNQISRINQLARYQTAHTVQLGTGAFTDGKGNIIHPINTKNAMHKLVHKLLDTTDSTAEEFKQDDFFSNNAVLNAFMNRFNLTPKDRHTLGIHVLDTSQDTRFSDEGIQYSELDTYTSIGLRMKLFNNPLKGKASKMCYIMTPTPGDKSNTSMLALPKLDEATAIMSGAILNTGSEYYNWFYDKLEAEYNRIRTVRQEFADAAGTKENLIVNYHFSSIRGGDGSLILGNGGYFSLDDNLNEYLTDELPETFAEFADSFNTFTKRSPKDNSVIASLAKDAITREIDFLIKQGVLSKSPRGNVGISKEFKEDNGVFDYKLADIHRFIANSIAYTTDMAALLNCDQAHYMGIRMNGPVMDNKALTAYYADINKRTALNATPGEQLRISSEDFPGGAREEFTVAILQDEYITSEYAEQYEIATGSYKYNGNNVTDAQGFMSITRYKEVVNSLGLGAKYQRHFDKLERGEDLTREELGDFVAQVLKGFYYGQSYNEVFNRIVPFNLKYSSLPLIPQLIKGNKKLTHIYNRMQEQGIDEVVMNTAVKVGAYNVSTVEEEQYNPITCKNEHWYRPLSVPYKHHATANYGSQTMKLITNNVENAMDYKVAGSNMSGKDLINEYQATHVEMLAKQFSKFRKQFVVNGKIDEGKLAALILKEIQTNSFTSVDPNIVKALTPNENGVLETPLSYPTIKHYVDSTINNKFKKAGNLELPGGSAVQATSLGFTHGSEVKEVDGEQVEVDKNLKYARLATLEGKELDATETQEVMNRIAAGENVADEFIVEPAEVLVSPQYFIERIREIAKEKKWNDKTYRMVLATFTDENGNFILDKIKGTGLEEFMFYRIPTQAKSSMLPAKVIGFLPTASGSTIIIPAEVTTQSGADYDIDKVYMEFKPFNIGISEEGVVSVDSGDTGEALNETQKLQKRIIDMHMAILQSPIHFGELMLPNGSDELIKWRNEARQVSTTYDFRQAYSLEENEGSRARNQAGKQMISVSSIASTFNSIVKQLGVKFMEVTVGGIKYSSFSNKHVQQLKDGKVVVSSKLISDNIAEIQTAAVDNAKDPILGDLNINLQTASVALFLTQCGVPLEYTCKFMQQDILKQMSRIMSKYEGKYSGRAAYNKAVSEIYAKEFKITKRKDIPDVTSGNVDISLRTLAENIKNPDKRTNKDILLRFRFLLENYGNDFSTLINALNTDKGNKQTLVENMGTIQNLNNIEGTYSRAIQIVKEHKLSPKAIAKEDAAENGATDLSAITFNEEEHTYNYKGKDLASTSSFINEISDVFDAEAISETMALTSEKTAEEIREQWGNEATEGTLVHANLENYANAIKDGVDIPDDVEVPENLRATRIQKLTEEGKKWLNDKLKEGYRIVETEKILGDANLGKGYAGMVDLLLEKDGKYYISDWKTNKDDKDGKPADFVKVYKDKSTGEGKKLKDVFKAVPDNKLNKYSIQTSMYKQMLENQGLDVAGTMIVHLSTAGAREFQGKDYGELIEDFMVKEKAYEDKLATAYTKDAQDNNRETVEAILKENPFAFEGVTIASDPESGPNMFRLDTKDWLNHFLSYYEEKELHGASNVLKDQLLEGGLMVKTARDLLPYVTNTTARIIATDAANYLANIDVEGNPMDRIIPEPDKLIQLFVGNDSFPREMLALRKRNEGFVKAKNRYIANGDVVNIQKYIGVRENLFLKNLSISTSKVKGELDSCTINTTVRKALSDEELAVLSNDILEVIKLMDKKSTIINGEVVSGRGAERFVAFCFGQNGFGMSRGSFTNLIPHEVWKSLGLIDHYKKVEALFRDSAAHGAAFGTKCIESKFPLMTEIRQVDNNDASRAKVIGYKTTEPGTFFKCYQSKTADRNGEWHLYRVGTKNVEGADGKIKIVKTADIVAKQDSSKKKLNPYVKYSESLALKTINDMLVASEAEESIVSNGECKS